MESSSSKREFVFESLGEGAYVEVSPEDTLDKVRKLIMEELDSYQLPSDEDGHDFAFKVNGIRLSSKQESRKKAFAIIDVGQKVELVSKSIQKKRKVSMESADASSHSVSNQERTDGPEPKRRKLNASANVTPHNEIKPIRGPSENDLSSPAREDRNEVGGCATPSSTKSVSTNPNPFLEGTKDFFVPPRKAVRSSSSPSGENDDDNPLLKWIKDDELHSDTNLFGVDNDNAQEEKEGDLQSDHDNDDVIEEQEEDLQIVNPDTNHHQTSDDAKEKSGDVLDKLESILHENLLFCSDVRRKDWLQEIQDLQGSQAPQTVFGVLGNTGVGKSSLLNALLDEAAVLPTSGSRGCTAAVVELVYHSELAAETEEEAPPRKVPVYQGAVEFMTLEDWKKELKILVEECSTEEKTIYARPPDQTKAQAAFAAWQKIEQVYGKDSMKKYHRKPTEYTFQALANDQKVRKHLTPTILGQEHNVITVEVGESTAGSEEARNFLLPASDMNRRMRRKRNKLAQKFRTEINSYVYRKGNGSEPQTWPLIRKVQLKGPWSVLSTGAVLVDLPGVRDSNAARAKVAQTYLQNCNQIAIVAPIKRAVDDGTAKELLGEQFKRRLLMDGQYGNVFFICTQTDDLEATETMQDHKDVAQQVPGRWEKMEELANAISMLENELNDFGQEEEDLAGKVEELTDQCKEAKAELREARDEEEDDETIDKLKAALTTHREALNQAKDAAEIWSTENKHEMDKLEGKCTRLQKKLKTLCAQVRNEYSKSCLQEDFRNGLEALYNNDDDNDGDGARANTQAQNALPEDYNMDVFCISSNDYLKLMGIKSNNDGQPNTFSCQRDTQIPQLRSFVHETTARFCETHAKSFVEKTNDLLDRMKLLATDASNVPTGRSAYKMMSQFEAEMKAFEQKVKQVANNFQTSLDRTIKQSLIPCLQKGAKSGQAVAMDTVVSWGSTSRRSRHERAPDKNGLYWSTYQAVVRRDGQYNSASAGAVDFNQELCDPMEKEFSTEWQAVLDSTIKRLLQNAEKSITQLCNEVTQRLASGFGESGMDSSRLTTLVTTAKRSSITALKTSFQQTLSKAVESQRDLSRTLLPAVQKGMTTTYSNALNVQRGAGTFMRMKGAMAASSQKAVNGLFFEAMNDLQNGVNKLIVDLQRLILLSSAVVQRSMGNVFSICWDDQSGKTESMDPVMMKKIRECRDALLPHFQNLCTIQLGACQLLGIEREEVELDVMGVETLDQSLERRLEEAKKNGDCFDLCDSDAEMPVVPKPRIKADPDRASTSVARAPSSFMQEVIDLCDSDDDWEAPPPSGLVGLARKPSQEVKSEML